MYKIAFVTAGRGRFSELTAWIIESPIEPLRELVRRNRGGEARHAIDGQHRTRLLRRVVAVPSAGWIGNS